MNLKLKEQLILLIFAGLVLLTVLNWSTVYSGILTVLGSMNSLLIGGLLAFILNVPMKNRGLD